MRLESLHLVWGAANLRNRLFQIVKAGELLRLYLLQLGGNVGK